MKKIELEMKGTYDEIVEYIKNNYDIEEPTEFIFKKIVRTNAKMRRRKEYKNVYNYEVEGRITLNDNNHKMNLYKKVFFERKFSYTSSDFARNGID